MHVILAATSPNSIAEKRIMTSRRTFLTAGGAASLVAALPSTVHATQTTTKSPKKPVSSLHSTIMTMSINTLKELGSPGPQKSLINYGEVHTHLTYLFDHLEATGVNAKIEAHIKANGGFSKARGNSAPFSTEDLTFFVEHLKSQGVPLAKSDVHTINQVLNSRTQAKNVAYMIDTHGISRTQRAVALAAHPKAEERWQLYDKAIAQMQPDSSELKMLIADPEAFQSYVPSWDPTVWWWWSEWPVWSDYQRRSQLLLEQQVVLDEPCACDTSWPNVDDPTNYTIYTEAILEANFANFLANGGQITFNTCKFLSSVSSFSLSQIISYLRANPEVLAEVAFVMEVAPEAVLLMGIILAIVLLAIAATC